MPRFHFNVYDGISVTDRDGTVLDHWQAARLEAVRLCGQLLRDDARRIVLNHDWRMEVTDEHGLVLFRLDFSIMAAPVLSDAQEPR